MINKPQLVTAAGGESMVLRCSASEIRLVGFVIILLTLTSENILEKWHSLQVPRFPQM